MLRVSEARREGIGLELVELRDVEARKLGEIVPNGGELR